MPSTRKITLANTFNQNLLYEADPDIIVDETISDDFSTLNTNRWTGDILTAIADGQLSFGVYSGYRGLNSRRSFSLSGQSIAVDLLQRAEGPNIETYYQFNIDGGGYVLLYESSGTLLARVYNTTGQQAVGQVSEAFNVKGFRLRGEPNAGNGILYLDFKNTEGEWITKLTCDAQDWPVTRKGSIQFAVGGYSGGGATTPAIFDNLVYTGDGQPVEPIIITNNEIRKRPDVGDGWNCYAVSKDRLSQFVNDQSVRFEPGNVVGYFGIGITPAAGPQLDFVGYFNPGVAIYCDINNQVQIWEKGGQVAVPTTWNFGNEFRMQIYNDNGTMRLRYWKRAAKGQSEQVIRDSSLTDSEVRQLLPFVTRGTFYTPNTFVKNWQMEQNGPGDSFVYVDPVPVNQPLIKSAGVVLHSVVNYLEGGTGGQVGPEIWMLPTIKSITGTGKIMDILVPVTGEIQLSELFGTITGQATLNFKINEGEYLSANGLAVSAETPNPNDASKIQVVKGQLLSVYCTARTGTVTNISTRFEIK